MKKFKITFSFVFSTIILTFVVLFSYNLHQQDLVTIEECFENFDESNQVVVKKEGLFSPVICE